MQVGYLKGRCRVLGLLGQIWHSKNNAGQVISYVAAWCRLLTIATFSPKTILFLIKKAVSWLEVHELANAERIQLLTLSGYGWIISYINVLFRSAKR